MSISIHIPGRNLSNDDGKTLDILVDIKENL